MADDQLKIDIKASAALIKKNILSLGINQAATRCVNWNQRPAEKAMVAGNLKEPGANSLWKWNKNKQAHYKYTQYKRQKSTIEITGKIDDDQVVVNRNN